MDISNTSNVGKMMIRKKQNSKTKLTMNANQQILIIHPTNYQNYTPYTPIPLIPLYPITLYLLYPNPSNTVPLTSTY